MRGLGGLASLYYFYGVAIHLHSSRPSASSLNVVSELSLKVGPKHPHLHWSGADRTSQGTAIPGSCQQAPLSNSISVWVWCLQTDKMDLQVWCSLDGTSISLYAIFFVPVFPLDRNISGLKTLRWVGGPIPQLGAMPIYWRWSLQVLSPLC